MKNNYRQGRWYCYRKHSPWIIIADGFGDGGLVQFWYVSFWWKKAQKFMFDIKHTIRAPDTFAPLEKILLPAENCHLFVNSCIIFIKTIQAGEV